MGLWTKSDRDTARAWVADNRALILNTYDTGYSVRHIQTLSPMKIGRDLVEKELRAGGREIRGLKQNGSSKCLEKARATSLEKFGVENASSLLEIKEKRKRTNIERFGVENTFQNEEIKLKIQETNISRYGHVNPSAFCPRNIKISKPHFQLSSALLAQGIPHTNEVVVKFENGRGALVDIMLSETLGIEVQGDYYHANPLKYDKEHLIKRFTGAVKAKEIWDLDRERANNLALVGVKIIQVWEAEIKQDLESVVKRIVHELQNCAH